MTKTEEYRQLLIDLLVNLEKVETDLYTIIGKMAEEETPTKECKCEG